MSVRGLIGAAVFSMAATGPVLAASPTWQGTFFVTATTSGCSLGGTNVGDFGTMLYRPLLSGIGSPEGLSLFLPRSAENIISNARNGSFRGVVNYTGVATGIDVTSATFTGASSLVIFPRTVTRGTKEITIKGNIDGFLNIVPDCDVNIEAVLVPRL